MDPMEVVRDLGRFIGNKGVISGGCIRDIIMGREPKDYDVHIFIGSHLGDIIDSWTDFFDYMPTRSEKTQVDDYGDTQTEVYDVTYKGHPVQLIHSNMVCIDGYPEEYNKNGEPRYPQSKFGDYKKSCVCVVKAFPFTINQMWYNVEEDAIIVEDVAQEAQETKHLVFNPGHIAGWDKDLTIRSFLFARAVYLAKKLDFTIPMRSIDDIYEKYGTYSLELADLV